MEEKIDKLTINIQNLQNRISILVRQLEQKQDEYHQFLVGIGRRPDWKKCEKNVKQMSIYKQSERLYQNLYFL